MHDMVGNTGQKSWMFATSFQRYAATQLGGREGKLSRQKIKVKLWNMGQIKLWVYSSTSWRVSSSTTTSTNYYH